MNKKTKNAVIFLVVVILALGCGSWGVTAANKYIENKSSVAQQIKNLPSRNETNESEDNQGASDTDDKSGTDSDASSDKGSGNSDKTGNRNRTAASSSSASSGKDDKKTNQSSASDSNKNTPNKGSSSSGGSAKPASGGSSNSSGSSNGSSTAKTYTCTFTIECTVLLSNMDELTEGKEEYVPSDGYIIRNYSIKAKEGETVYSLLQRVCSANGIPVSTQNTGWGKYISGINNLDQKDCGSDSGWKYKVNGTYPGHTCEKEKIKSNSTIVWEYVTHA